jgi:glutathione S-transferase
MRQRRLLLNHAGVKFEDIRFTMESWPELKDKFELKQVPVLEDNGKMYCQMNAILEYLGKKYGPP